MQVRVSFGGGRAKAHMHNCNMLWLEYLWFEWPKTLSDTPYKA